MVDTYNSGSVQSHLSVMTVGWCTCFQAQTDVDPIDLWAEEYSMLSLMEEPTCHTIPPGLVPTADEHMDMTMQTCWTIDPETQSSTSEENMPPTSEEGTPRQACQQNAVESTSLVEKLAFHFQKTPLLSRYRLKSLRTGMTGAADMPMSGTVSNGETIEYHSQWQDAWIKTKVTAVKREGTYDLDCQPGAPRDRLSRPMLASSSSEQQQRQQQQQVQQQLLEHAQRQRSNSCNATEHTTHRSAGAVHRQNGNGSCWLDCKRYASVLSIRPRGARSMPPRTSIASWASRAISNPSRFPQDSCALTVGKTVVHDSHDCKLSDAWANATTASTNADGSYVLDVNADASPTQLQRPVEGIFATKIPEDAFKTRVPAELLQELSTS
mmetsp:Transcript_37798/g.72703  ORF Transcript_37798/g.72703 Transcript_37798/m.72703 type:complete len:381 (-) Transcript_37798:33-1175(-)